MIQSPLSRHIAYTSSGLKSNIWIDTPHWTLPCRSERGSWSRLETLLSWNTLGRIAPWSCLSRERGSLGRSRGPLLMLGDYCCWNDLRFGNLEVHLRFHHNCTAIRHQLSWQIYDHVWSQTSNGKLVSWILCFRASHVPTEPFWN